MELKEKLLQTGFFINNKQLLKYIDIVTTESDTKYTEKHHILPRSYFKLTGQKIDNSKNNIVKLSYFNHILAHYYLSFCTTQPLRQSSICAFIMLIETGYQLLSEDEQKAITEIAKYAELKEAARILRQEACSIIGKEKSPEHKQALSKARDLHATTKGRKSIYNPDLNCVKFVFESELPQYLENGWKLGGKPLTQEAKNKIGQSNSIALKGKKHQAIPENKTNSGLTFNKVICLETGTIFDSILEAKKWLQKTVGIEGGQIKNCCAKRRETTGGYHWEYYKE